MCAAPGGAAAAAAAAIRCTVACEFAATRLYWGLSGPSLGFRGYTSRERVRGPRGAGLQGPAVPDWVGVRGHDQGWDQVTVVDSGTNMILCHTTSSVLTRNFCTACSDTDLVLYCAACRAGRTPVDEALARDYTVSIGAWKPWHLTDTFLLDAELCTVRIAWCAYLAWPEGPCMKCRDAHAAVCVCVAPVDVTRAFTQPTASRERPDRPTKPEVLNNTLLSNFVHVCCLCRRFSS